VYINRGWHQKRTNPDSCTPCGPGSRGLSNDGSGRDKKTCQDELSEVTQKIILTPFPSVIDQFEWDTPLDAKLFVPEVPADYTRIDAKAPAPNEATLIKALGNYAELAGKYPTALNAGTISLDLAGAVGRKAASAKARGETMPGQQELMQKMVEIRSGIAFYLNLAEQGHSPEYFGKTVSPGQKDAVLVRWKTEDGQWRVIYGDLRVETLPNQ